MFCVWELKCEVLSCFIIADFTITKINLCSSETLKKKKKRLSVSHDFSIDNVHMEWAQFNIKFAICYFWKRINAFLFFSDFYSTLLYIRHSISIRFAFLSSSVHKLPCLACILTCAHQVIKCFEFEQIWSLHIFLSGLWSLVWKISELICSLLHCFPG